MRSGPATRTAFAMRESRRCPSPRSPARFLKTSFNASRKPAFMLQRSFHTEVQLHPNRADRSQSRHARPFSEEAATPGSPATLSRFGNLQQLALRLCLRKPKRQLLQNQPCAITGSVTSTPAVNALSNIPERFAIRNRNLTVRILWTLRIPCGRARKRWEETHPPQQRAPLSPSMPAAREPEQRNHRTQRGGFDQRRVRTEPLRSRKPRQQPAAGHPD